MFINQILTKLKSLVYSKSETDSLLNGKASSSHTHTKSQITDFPTIPTKTSDLTNDSGFLTSHQDLSGYIPKSGGNVLTGETYKRNVDGGSVSLHSGTAWDKGAYIELSSATRSNEFAGSFMLQATTSSSSYKRLIGYPDGTLTWGNKEIDTIEEQGNNYIRYSSGLQICWGEYNKTTETNSTINFPKAFIIGIDRRPLSISVSGQTQTLFAGGWSSGYVFIANTNLGSFTYTAIGRWK